MKETDNIEREIMLCGYYGIRNWLMQHNFETVLTQDVEAMDEVHGLVDRCYALLTARLFQGVETVAVEYVELPLVCAFLEKECPSQFNAKEWTYFAQEILYSKLSLIERINYPVEFPSWCDMLAKYVLMQIGQKCAADRQFQNLELLTRLMETEELSWDFYRGFVLSEDVLKEAEKNLEIKPHVILGGCRMLEMAQSAYDLSGQTQEQILEDLWLYEQNGGYVEFPEMVVLVAQGYRNAGMDDAFVALWKKLSHPILQYGLLYYIAVLPDDCVVLIEMMKKKCMDKVGITLVRDFWFKVAVHTLEKLLLFEQNKDTKDALLAGIMSVAENVRSKFEGDLMVSSQKMLDFFTAEELTKWAYSMNTLGDKQESVYKKAYLTVLNTLKEVLDSAAVDTFSTDTKDLQYLIFLAQKAIEAQDKDKCKQLEKVILQVIDSGNFEWFGSMNQDVLNQMIVLSLLLHDNHTGLELKNMVWMRIVKYEGWKKTPIERVSDQARISSYFLSAALLVEQDENYFKTLVGWAVDQANNVMIPSDALLAPLYVAELWVTYYKEEWRDWFEQTVLNELESLESVVKVLMQAQARIPDATKTMFEQRKDEEWDFVKQQYHTAKRQQEWRNMEKMMKILLENSRD